MTGAPTGTTSPSVPAAGTAGPGGPTQLDLLAGPTPEPLAVEAAAPQRPRALRALPGGERGRTPERSGARRRSRTAETAPVTARPGDADPAGRGRDRPLSGAGAAADPEAMAEAGVAPGAFAVAEDDPAIDLAGRRLLAGGLDLAVVVAFTWGVGALARLLLPGGRTLFGAPLLLAGVLFSFAYVVLPLVAWGRTAGLWAAGLEVRADPSRTADAASDGAWEDPAWARCGATQAVARWLGGLLTVLGLGLPSALLWTGASLSDRLSRSYVVAPR